jgi:signal peptidase I
MESPSQDTLDPQNNAIVPESFSMANAVVPPTARAGGIGLWVRDLLISAGISILIITFLYQPVRVEGTSMLPRLEDHDRLFINKFVYHIESIQRGDVVVFHYPRDPEKSYIKRVIGLPGDRVAKRHPFARNLRS